MVLYPPPDLIGRAGGVFGGQTGPRQMGGGRRPAGTARKAPPMVAPTLVRPIAAPATAPVLAPAPAAAPAACPVLDRLGLPLPAAWLPAYGIAPRRDRTPVSIHYLLRAELACFRPVLGRDGAPLTLATFVADGGAVVRATGLRPGAELLGRGCWAVLAVHRGPDGRLHRHLLAVWGEGEAPPTPVGCRGRRPKPHQTAESAVLARAAARRRRALLTALARREAAA